MTDTQTASQQLSAEEASMDQMVQAASVPSLASLFQKAKDTGLIKPMKEYGSTS